MMQGKISLTPQDILEKDFKEIELLVDNFGLYEIYPAKLVKLY